MTVYKAPLRDVRFILEELVHAEQLPELPGYSDATLDQVEFVLSEIGSVCEQLLFPLNRPGDEEGCHFADGGVTTPRGFREAYEKYVEAGWPSLACDPMYEGMGLPKLVSFLAEEMLSASNLSFSVYVLLTAGAYGAILKHGSDELKRTFLPAMAEGRWGGTMCLTEAQCGTDLGLVRTRAVPCRFPRGCGATRLPPPPGRRAVIWPAACSATAWSPWRAPWDGIASRGSRSPFRQRTSGSRTSRAISIS